jgi:hypothetical protein
VSTLSLTLDRTSLSLSDLVIAGTAPSAGLWIELADNPDFLFRYTYAPDSAYVPGKQLLAAVLDQATLPVTVHGQAASANDLSALRDELSAALAQFSYPVTLTLDGISTTWSADCSTAAFGSIDSGQQQALIFSANLVIPVNPPGAP